MVFNHLQEGLPLVLVGSLVDELSDQVAASLGQVIGHSQVVSKLYKLPVLTKPCPHMKGKLQPVLRARQAQQVKNESRAVVDLRAKTWSGQH